MPVDLRNLRTPRIDKWAADRIWPEVVNVDQDAVAVPDAEIRPKPRETVTEARSGERREAQMRLELM